MKTQKKFNDWLDKILSEAKELPIAWNFNLYENEESFHVVELVGTKKFDAENEDWACDEKFSSREINSNFLLPLEVPWEESLRKTIAFVKCYLNKGKYKNKLLETKAVACGFVSGDLELVYINQSKESVCAKEQITMDKINSLPLLQLCSWITVYTDYDKARFRDKLWDFQYNGLEPTEEELNDMRKFLYESLNG
ncbi:MAG: hypothetical protein FWC11_05240 [Firmicutes bacterium]|nr:hypothetical protein [Bacillota bacterium]